MSARERRIAHGDGATTILESWGTSGPAILAVHGIGSSRKDFRRLGDALAGRARVFAYDQRGHGESAEVLGPMTIDRLQRDLRTIVDATGETIRLLLGHSWGGAMALLGGRALPVERVLAVDPLIRATSGTWEVDYAADLREPLALPPERREPLLRKLFAGANEADVAAKLHALGTMRIDPILALGSENAVDAGGWDLTASLAAYPKPLLVLLADPEDSIVGETERGVLLTRGGPNVRVEQYAGEPHSLHRTAFDRFAADVAGFAEI